jgi:hypothetical protein
VSWFREPVASSSVHGCALCRELFGSPAASRQPPGEAQRLAPFVAEDVTRADRRTEQAAVPPRACSNGVRIRFTYGRSRGPIVSSTPIAVARRSRS